VDRASLLGTSEERTRINVSRLDLLPGLLFRCSVRHVQHRVPRIIDRKGVRSLARVSVRLRAAGIAKNKRVITVYGNAGGYGRGHRRYPWVLVEGMQRSMMHVFVRHWAALGGGVGSVLGTRRHQTTARYRRCQEHSAALYEEDENSKRGFGWSFRLSLEYVDSRSGNSEIGS